MRDPVRARRHPGPGEEAAAFIITLSIPTADPTTPEPTYPGQVGQFEQPLHGAVLAVGTVEEREHDVDVERATGPSSTTGPPP